MNELNIDMQEKKVKAWLKSNLKDPITKELLFDKSTHAIGQYILGQKDRAPAAMALGRLEQWHLMCYAHERCNLNSSGEDSLALASAYLLRFTELSSELAAMHGTSGVVLGLLLDDAALAIALSAICNQEGACIGIFHVLARNLDTPMLDLQHNERHARGELYKHFWFIMEMMCDFLNLAIDKSKYSYPTDMRPYDEVLRNWKTTDVEWVQDAISQMATYHLDQSRSAGRGNFREFDRNIQKMFPYEILFFLRLREWSGLDNPLIIDHPLMKKSLAYLPNRAIPTPEDPLLSAFMNT